MRRLIRITLLIVAFLGGCEAQNWIAMDRCTDRGGTWVDFQALIPGGVCQGARVK